MRGNASGFVAMKRLKMILADEKCEIDEETMASIQKEVATIIIKYLDIEPEDVNIKIILKEYKKKEVC